eukprot:GHUV01008559.1.p1 GENE.GHUV01008559.1~~GHUV01008559.1.p1  ORF type:complete len:495 (+),score=53.30 GHUV01008559.1:75-1559(+)
MPAAVLNTAAVDLHCLAGQCRLAVSTPHELLIHCCRGSNQQQQCSNSSPHSTATCLPVCVLLCSYPMAAKDTIPNYLATLLNWICLIMAVIFIELILFRRQHSLTVAICGTIHHIWCCLVSFVIVVAITEITKPFSGRLRPDFLHRCQPAGIMDPSSNVATTLSQHAATFAGVHFGQVAGACQSDEALVHDGRLSFPSGHSSNSMSLAWYTSLYLMWSLYLRVDNPYPKKLYVATTIMGRFVQEVAYALAYGFILLTLCLSWFIGMTRFWDNRHNVSDIIGGFVLAIFFVTPFVIKAIVSAHRLIIISRDQHQQSPSIGAHRPLRVHPCVTPYHLHHSAPRGSEAGMSAACASSCYQASLPTAFLCQWIIHSSAASLSHSCCCYGICCRCCTEQGLHIAFRNQIDTGEEAAKAIRSHTSIMAAPPAGDADNMASLAPFDARAGSDIEPAAGPPMVPVHSVNSHSKPHGGSGLYPQLPGRPSGGDVVLQMNDRQP